MEKRKVTVFILRPHMNEYIAVDSDLAEILRPVMARQGKKRGGLLEHSPKHMEKMLLVNYREEVGLQRRLHELSANSRAKGMELDRERIRVRNEWRYSSRLKHTHVAPMLEQIPALLKRECPHPKDSVDEVNAFLLREYRKNKAVIPAILDLLSNTENGGGLFGLTQPEDDESLNNSRKNKRFNVRKDSRNRRTEEQEDEIDPIKVARMVRYISQLRSEIAFNRNVELSKPRKSFQDLLRGLQEGENSGSSESDTYTDGTCALLRRKMKKMRSQDAPVQSVEVTLDTNEGVFKVERLPPEIVEKKRKSSMSNQALPVVAPRPSISNGTLPPIHGRQMFNDTDGDLKKQMEAQERYHTELKVAKETEKYRHIQKKVSDFLEKNKPKRTLPLLFQETMGE